jgi:hypothetical protein
MVAMAMLAQAICGKETRAEKFEIQKVAVRWNNGRSHHVRLTCSRE